jgi:hypothetical protein
MSDPGPAQLELIRRYARTLRVMHADAMRARGSRAAGGGGQVRRVAVASDPLRQVAEAMTAAPAPRPRRLD